jgi:choline dehydrogenase-like flavoprotein
VIAPLNLRGFVEPDPLDRLSFWPRQIVASLVTFAVCAAYFYVVFDVLAVAGVNPGWLKWVEVAGAALVFSPIVVALRKASSFVPMSLLYGVMVPLDIWVEAHLRKGPKTGPWWYEQDGLLGPLHDSLLQIAVAWAIDVLVMGPICLWLARLVVGAFTQDDHQEPTVQQQEKLFEAEPLSRLPKSHRNFSHYVLRIVGLSYLGYLLLFAVGLLGKEPWPTHVRDLLGMSYANPALAINTIVKITIMVNLAFIGAYNASLRYHTSIVLLVGHVVSTVASLAFYFGVDNDDRIHGFLLTSAVVDAVFSALLVWNIVAHRDLANRFKRSKEFPEFFSLPNRFTIWFYRIFAAFCAVMVVGVLAWRFGLGGTQWFGVVFNYPDPQICNTLTMYATLATLGWLIADREELREDLLSVIQFGYAIKLAASVTCMLGAGWAWDARADTRDHGPMGVDWFLAANIALDSVVVAGVLWLRKAFYDVDYGIVALSPSTAHNVMSIHEALFRRGNGMDDHGAIARAADRHIAGIRGRKRGIINFPFWLLEHVIGVISWLRPAFSSMSPEERHYALRKYVLRPPTERARALVPPLAEIVYKLGTSAHAFVALAHYSSSKSQRETGYVPPDARARLQGPEPSDKPGEASRPAPMPTDPGSPDNFARGVVPTKDNALIAPRLVTPDAEAAIPDEVDYLVVGSGAGGAVMAYRLACEVARPSRILVVERGPRFSPLTDFSDNEMEMVRRLYKEGGLQLTKRFDLTILQGECVGGSTVINNGICIPMPDAVRSDWRDRFGLGLDGLDEQYERVADEIGIVDLPDKAVNGAVAKRFTDAWQAYNQAQSTAATKLGNAVLKCNHRNPLGTGLDNIGDRHMRKRSMLETYLPWAEGRGVEILSEHTVVSLSFEPRRDGTKHCTSVLLRGNMGQLRKIKVKKAVILAGGVVASSHVLLRSDVTQNVGRNVACNFALPAALEFAETLDAFDGLQITKGAENIGHHAVFETYFNPPGAFAISIPFYFERLKHVMSHYRKMVNFGALVASEPMGVIERTPSWLDGRPVSWELGQTDVRNIKFALKTLFALGMHAGAKRVVLPTEPGFSAAPNEDTLRHFSDKLDAYPLRMRDLHLVTAHPQGGNRMADADSEQGASRAVDSDYRVSGLHNVFVADASIFPTGITVNPQWTIMALSSMAAAQVCRLMEDEPSRPRDLTPPRAAAAAPAERATESSIPPPPPLPAQVSTSES